MSQFIFIEQKKVLEAITLAWIEIIGHAAICTLAIGFDTGFHYYMLVLFPLIFVNTARSTFSKISVSVILCMAYMALDYVSGTWPPLNATRGACY